MKVPVCVLTWCLLSGFAVGQQVNIPSSLSDDSISPSSQDGQSLGEAARRMRKDTTTEVKMTGEDTKILFAAVDKITAFAAEDTGFPKRASVKRQLVGKAEVEKYTRDQTQKAEYVRRFGRAELTMKKFGLLPKEFNLRDFIVRANGQQIAGYYDPETKTISLLNWVPPDRQEPILAHELTHALQDQNYDLKSWMTPGQSEENDSSSQEADESATARKAVVEGQAMIVYVDYLLAPFGRSLKNTPGLIYQMEDPAVKAGADSQILHDAPMILREAGAFPYREGLIFEGELLATGGKQMAFAGVFAHPPHSSHEVMQPRAYIDREKLQPVHIPDVSSILSGAYEAYDSGTFGELDVRALLRQYGTRKVADDLSAAWQGGSYVAFRKNAKEGPAQTSATPATTADLALLYVSHWKSAETAEHFAHFYVAAVSERYHNAMPQPVAACAAEPCPVSAVQIATEEGPVIIEHWGDNSVVVSESFAQDTAAKLRNAVRGAAPDVHVESRMDDELGLRLFEMPGFSALQHRIGETVIDELAKRTAN